jgi:hypothetical protein
MQCPASFGNVTSENLHLGRRYNDPEKKKRNKIKKKTIIKIKKIKKNPNMLAHPRRSTGEIK